LGEKEGENVLPEVSNRMRSIRRKHKSDWIHSGIRPVISRSLHVSKVNSGTTTTESSLPHTFGTYL
jgi:hypothetical protein